MKYKKDDGKKDNWLDDILWGVPLGDSFAINLKSGEVIPRYRIGDGFIPGENGDDDWEKDEFAFDADDDWDKEDWEKDEFAFDDDDDDDDEYEFELSFDFGIRDASEFSRRDADTTEEQYYDPDRRVYCVGRAIRDNFKEIADSFSVEEMFSLVQCINVIFSSNQKLAVNAVAWAVEKFPKSLEGATCEGYRCGLPTDQFLSAFTYTEHGEDRSFVYDYLETHPEFTKAVLNRQPFSLPGWPTRNYLPYLAEKGDVEKFIEVYKLHIENPRLDPVECSKFKLIDDLIFRMKDCCDHIDHRIYSFLRSETESMPEKLKADYLLGQLDYERCGKPLFDKPPAPGKESVFAQIEQARKRIKEIEEERSGLYRRINELEEERDCQEELLKEIERQYAGEDDI